MKTPITPLRMPLELKESARAAAKQGHLSLSQWIFKAMRFDIAIEVINKDKLRAAAPDMLYALIKAEAALDIQIQIFKEKKIVWSFGVETLNTIRTAIKKATE